MPAVFKRERRQQRFRYDSYCTVKVMQKTIIHFAHANGFPSGTYNKLFELLEPEYSVISIDRLGHSAMYPVDDNWVSLTGELIEHIEDNCDGPVIGLGHSLGATLNFRAAYERPHLFQQVIMLDPPLVYGPFALFLCARLSWRKPKTESRLDRDRSQG